MTARLTESATSIANTMELSRDDRNPSERERSRLERPVSAIAVVLREIFNDDDAARLFVVLRNGDELPERLSGNDLDIATLPGVTMERVVEFITARAARIGWLPLCVNRRRRSVGFSVVAPSSDLSTSALHVDVFDGISAFGVSLVDARLLEVESVVRHHVRQLTTRARVLVTLAHHVASSGALTKDVYLEELHEVLKGGEWRWLLNAVTHTLGERVAGEMRRDTASDQRHPLRQPSRRRQLGALRNAMRDGAHGLRSVAAGIAGYVVGQIPSLLRPAGIVGQRGELVRGQLSLPLTDSLACGVAPLAMLADDVRSRVVRTENSSKHREHIARIWSAWAEVRWLLPSLFLWLQAKRGRIVVLDRLPLGLRVLRSVAAPRWITTPVPERR